MRFLLLLLVPFSLLSQRGDILLLQKNHKTIRTWFTGSNIDFFTADHNAISASIDSVKNDTLYLGQYELRLKTNAYGTTIRDTIFKYNLLFGLSDIYSVPANRRGSNVLGSGVLFMAAGAGYLTLNIINTLAEGEKVFGDDNIPRLVLGSSLLAAGVIQRMIHQKRQEYRIGKKFQFKALSSRTPSK
jgi:hypothetical protein